MEKLTLQSPDLTARNIERIAELFPNVITETRDAAGDVKHGVDFDLLRQELAPDLVEAERERYRLDWPGKRAALLQANTPINKTLRPDRDESVDFDTTKNLFIEGDNLDALKLLQESYLGKVKLIYIDPPYNTGNDFIYRDDFKSSASKHAEQSGEVDEDGNRLVANPESNGRFHSDWLSMMYPRLKLARNLLKDDGVIFISIDDHEADKLKKLCCEVFGERNFVTQIVWQKVYSPKNSARWFSEDHDYVLVFARDRESWQPRQLQRTPEMEARYKNLDDDPRGPWKAADVTARNAYAAGVYPITTPSGRVIAGPPTGRYWALSRATFEELDADGRIWWGAGGDNAPAVKRFLSEVSAGRTPQTLWTYQEVGHTQDAKKTLLRHVPFENTENVLNSVKPVGLIQRVLQLAGEPNDGDIVVDFFSDSGTTAHAVLQQNADDGGNRRFIAIQAPEPLPQPEPGFDSILGMSLTRVRSAGAQLAEEAAELDAGFRVLRVDSSSLVGMHQTASDIAQTRLLDQVATVKADRTAEDLLFQVLVDWGLDLASPITRESRDGFDVFTVDSGALVMAVRDESLSLSLSLSLVARDIAGQQPLRAVFLDADFASDAERINVEQLFRELAPHTKVRAV